MSEIKFACPHCAQHVACDSDYADMCIVCPGCGKPMLVPILSALDAAHPGLCLVAAPPAPRQKFRSRIPALDPWTEEEWEQHVKEMPRSGMDQTQVWLLAFLISAPGVAMILLSLNGATLKFAMGLGLTLGLVGSPVAGWLAVRNSSEKIAVRTVTAGLTAIGLMLMHLSLFAFVGCCASIQVD